MKYRKLTDLTDEEITFIMKEVFETDTVTSIVRDEKWQRIDCDIHIMDYEDGSPLYDTITLDSASADYPLSTHDFDISSDETEKYVKFLLAKGVDWRFEDNKYMNDVDYVIETGVVCKQKVGVKPIEHHYEQPGDKPYIKYGCPICENLLDCQCEETGEYLKKFSFAKTTQNCPCCNINLIWEE